MDWIGTWNYEQRWPEDHFALPVYEMSRMLNRVTRLQVTSPDLDGRESEIPIFFDQASTLDLAKENLMVCDLVFIL